MAIISGVCGKCRKYFQGSWCSECEKIDVDRTLNFINDFHDSYYDNALGQVIHSKQHRNQVMKEKGLIEYGTEKWENISPEKRDRDREKREEKEQFELNKRAYQILSRNRRD